MADRVKKTKKLGAVLVAAALAVASVVGDPSGPANAAEAAQNSVGDTAVPDPFYGTAGVSPAVPGEILRKQTAPYSNVLGSTGSALPDEATKIMYTTTDNAPETGPSSGVDGSGVSSPEGILAAIIIAVLGIIGVGLGSAVPMLRQMLKI